MKTIQRFQNYTLLLLAGLMLSGCDISRLVSVEAPVSVGANETVPVSVTHVWAPESLFLGEEEAELMFMIDLPPGWTAPESVSYSGTLIGSPIALTLARLPGPPEDNTREFIEAQAEDEGNGDGGDEGLEEDIAEYNEVSCSNTPPSLVSSTNLVFYRATEFLPEGSAVESDGGTFSFEMTSGAAGGPVELSFAHGVYVTATNTFGDEGGPVGPDPITSCIFILDLMAGESEGFPPPIAFISARLAEMGGPGFTRPVPVGGLWLVLSLSLGLLASGVWLGRKRLNQPDQ